MYIAGRKVILALFQINTKTADREEEEKAESYHIKGGVTMSRALILGGGAPNATLMSGALCALEEKGVSFDVISTSGAGALIGLLYRAPKGQSSIEALKGTVSYGISDPIYRAFPVNFKVFQKPGIPADLYRHFLQAASSLWRAGVMGGGDAVHRYLSDCWQLMASSFCPSSLNWFSRGLCANVPFIEEVIDFAKLKDIRESFYINAYNIDDRRMENFGKEEITADHFRAAMSFPFIYPPCRINGKYYFEGASVDCLNYKSLVDRHPEVKTIVVFDVLGSEKLIREPKNIYDAWVISIIVPLVEIARDDTKIFETKYNVGRNKRKLLKVVFEIPEGYWPNVLDWSYGNLKTLFEIGYRSGLKFYKENASSLS